MIGMLADLIALVVTLMKIDITVSGFTFSLWQLMIFVAVAGIIIDLVWRFLDG